MKRLKIKRLTNTAKLPTRGSRYAAGWDLYADIDKEIDIPPHSSVLVNTGIAIELPICTFGAIYPRSGLAIKNGVNLGNCVAVIDEDYRGEVKIGLHNYTNEYKTILPGERVAQLVVQKYEPIVIKEVDNLSETKRGSNGLGSTGRK